LFRQIYAWFVPQGATTTAPAQLEVHPVHTPQAIPTSVKVPATARTGGVQLVPYLAPCAYGWVPDYVTVQFVNIAV